MILALLLLSWLAIPGSVLPDFTPDRGGGGIEIRPAPFVALFGFGFLLAAGGHLYKSNFVVGLGLAIVMLALVLIPVALYVSGAAG